MKTAVAIFAKTPGHSPVKTRLAERIGTPDAEKFYEFSVAAIEETVNRVVDLKPDIYPHWALAEETSTSLKRWQRFPAIWTGDGGLGTRLAAVSEALFQSYDAVVLLGTDSPQLQAKQIIDAVDLIEAQPDRFVIGPAEDGGFYLFGSQTKLPRSLWENVTYSTHTTCDELRSLLKQTQRDICELKVEQDVDTLDDFEHLAKRLENLNGIRTQAQTRLLDWMISTQSVRKSGVN